LSTTRGATSVGGVGVTAHFFAFDPRVYATPPTTDRWLAEGALDPELEVTKAAASALAEIQTPLGDNKRWSDNLAGDFAWSCARKHVDPGARDEIDRWLSHLFWDADGRGCPCGRSPIVVADQEVIYDRALLEHVVSLKRSLAPAEAALAFEFAGDPPRTERFHASWIYELDGLEWLTSTWHQIFERAVAAGPGWSLLQWVWY
jgi:hypothetical protein